MDDDDAVDALVQAATDSAATMPISPAELAQEAFSADGPPDHARWLAIGEQVVALLVRVQREGAVLSIAGKLIRRHNRQRCFRTPAGTGLPRA